MRILFIDDDEVDRHTVVRLVRETDITLRVAASLREGLDIVVAEKFDCVLVDFQLGLDTAFDFLSATQQAEFPTIVLTGHANEELALGTLRHGAQDYLRKDSLSKELLLRAIRYAVERKGKLLEIASLNTQLKIANARLQGIAQHDPLTGVLNRRGLEGRLEVEAQRARRTGSDMMALFIDCDDFKSINTIHGYVMGDRVLQEVSQVLKKTVRPTDHVARVGGDEFLVLLGDIRSNHAIGVAEKIEDAIRTLQISSPSGTIELSCSIGCCPVGEDEASLDLIIRRAERALNQSKLLGKDTVSTLQLKAIPVNVEKEHERALVPLLNRLESGVDLHVVAQPIIKLSNHTVVGHELYTHGPPGEYEMPDVFLQLALTANRGVAVDMACLRAFCNNAKALSKTGEWRIHINLFPTTPKAIGIDPVMQVLREIREVSGRPICVEFSERHFVGPPADFQYLAESLASEGMLLALDAVRLSRCGLEMLLFLEPAFLKVDRHLIIGAHRDPGRFRILKRLVDLAARRSIQSVAVGITSDGELEVVKQLGFDLGQGDYIGKREVLV